jgi:hypothetical protein
MLLTTATSSVKSITHKPGLFAKVNAYVFYVIRRTSKSAWDDGMEDWKALCLMSIVMAFGALGIVCVISICLQRRVLLPSGKVSFVALFSMVMMCFLGFNHYSLVFKHRWSRFEREFQHQSNPKRVIGSIIVWAALILIVLAAEWAGSIAIKLPTL